MEIDHKQFPDRRQFDLERHKVAPEVDRHMVVENCMIVAERHLGSCYLVVHRRRIRFGLRDFVVVRSFQHLLVVALVDRQQGDNCSLRAVVVLVADHTLVVVVVHRIGFVVETKQGLLLWTDTHRDHQKLKIQSAVVLGNLVEERRPSVVCEIVGQIVVVVVPSVDSGHIAVVEHDRSGQRSVVVVAADELVAVG